MSKKGLEVALKCGVMINMVIYDPRTNRLEERFTDDAFDLNAVNQMKQNQKMVGRKNFKFKSQNISKEMAHVLKQESDMDDGTDEACVVKKHPNLLNQNKKKEQISPSIFKITKPSQKVTKANSEEAECVTHSKDYSGVKPDDDVASNCSFDIDELVKTFNQFKSSPNFGQNVFKN